MSINPDAVLKAIRELQRKAFRENNTNAYFIGLADAIADLDKHLSNGGSLPIEWKTGREQGKDDNGLHT